MTRPGEDRGRTRPRDKKAQPSPRLDTIEWQTAMIWEGKDLSGREDQKES